MLCLQTAATAMFSTYSAWILRIFSCEQKTRWFVTYWNCSLVVYLGVLSWDSHSQRSSALFCCLCLTIGLVVFASERCLVPFICSKVVAAVYVREIK